MSGPLSLREARHLIIDACTTLDVQELPLADALGMVAAQDVTAVVSHPPHALAAMDGYAVRNADCALGSCLEIIGESRAGAPFDGSIAEGKATLISTGAHIPDGADRVLILEDGERSANTVRVTDEQSDARHIRHEGIDFSYGDILVHSGTRLTPAALALTAAAGLGTVAVQRRPRVAVLTNGDELLDPGTSPAGPTVYDSNSIALPAQFTAFGAEAHWIGRAGDRQDQVKTMLARRANADLLVIAGGASVGPHDLVKGAFAALGGTIVFSKVALKPGKPVWFGKLPSGTHVLGLPGNPASSYVTAELFGRLAIQCLTGTPPALDVTDTFRPALVSENLPANGPRDTFQRAVLSHRADGATAIAQTGSQDSSLLRPLAAANALLFRNANAPAIQAGALVSYLPL